MPHTITTHIPGGSDLMNIEIFSLMCNNPSIDGSTPPQCPEPYISPVPHPQQLPFFCMEDSSSLSCGFPLQPTTEGREGNKHNLETVRNPSLRDLFISQTSVT